MDNDDFLLFNMEIIDPVVPLLQKFVNGELLSEQELIMLEKWKNQSAENAALFTRLGDPSFLQERLSKWNEIEKNRELNKQRGINMVAATILQPDQLVNQAFHENQIQPGQPLTADLQSADTPAVRRVHFLKTAWFRYAAAIIILFGIGAYLRNANKKNIQPPVVAQQTIDIAPGKDGAILTLADGSQVVLDSLGNGVIALQSGSQAAIKNGELVYNVTGEAAVEMVCNTMTTPKGRQYQITLPDGTKVWLNASSSITYPVSFTGDRREVTIQGEAYFEVAKNKQKPFIVNIDGKSSVEVLGTSFNINAYANEEVITTTLLEGSVRVEEKVTLIPGQQSVSSATNLIPQIIKSDIDRTLAWKNGLFNFDGLDIRAVMRQIERWYDISVQYRNNIRREIFRGKIERSVPLSDVLDILQEVSDVRFRLEGKTLYVN